MRFVPRKLFLTRGVGNAKEKLTSFEMALRSAGIAHVNLVRVSSIFPPGCRIVSPEEGLAALEAGEVTFAVLAEMADAGADALRDYFSQRGPTPLTVVNASKRVRSPGVAKP